MSVLIIVLVALLLPTVALIFFRCRNCLHDRQDCQDAARQGLDD